MCEDGKGGVEAAKTGESDAQGSTFSGARDGTVGVVHNVIAYHKGQVELCQWQCGVSEAKPLIPRKIFTQDDGWI